MCGIAGIVGHIEPTAATKAVAKMTQALARRGPDGDGIESWDGAVLGHRRLAIFDLSDAGQQPMVSRDRSIGVVFNGAIYNYCDLRNELMTRGYSFKSQTDTEVLIHGYAQWGVDKLVSKLRGMFAFGLWDNRTKNLFLVRDRLGVKPLVFSSQNGCLAFASTVRAFRAADIADELDERAVLEFLRFGFVTDDRSIYRNLFKVPAASILQWTDGVLTDRRYWVPPAVKTSSIRRFDEAIEQTEQLILDAVAVRLHADVPVGALLSGGVDSSLVCWAIKHLGRDIKAFTIAVPGDPWDEAKAARETAQVLGIQHQILEVSDRDQLDIDELVSAYSEPFACASALGMLKISRAVASTAKVLLTGDGGDDVFLGYPSHRNLWLATRFSTALPSVVKHAWKRCRSTFPRIGPLRRAAAFLDYTTGNLDAFFNSHNASFLPSVDQCLGQRLRKQPNHASPSQPRVPSDEVIEEALSHERSTRFVGEYMTKIDGSTMHYGLEARSPFLDQFLWEFASALSFDVRLHAWRPKAILRELASKRISRRVANRRKTGFGIPVQRWMVGRWRPQIEAAFQDSILDSEGWIRADSVISQLGAAAGRGWAPQQLWYLFVLESWMKSANNGKERRLA